MRITTSVVLFYLWVSATASAIEAIGVAADMGLETVLSVDSGLENAVDGLNSIQGSGGTAEALVGIYTVGTAAIEIFVGGLTAGPRLMIAAGVPAEFVLFLAAPVPLLAGRMMIYGLTGRSL